MWCRNNGDGATQNIQNRFTAYLVTAVQRQRKAYMFKKNQVTQMEYYFIEDESRNGELIAEQDLFGELPLFMRLESDSLIYALKQLTEKERYVFLERVLNEVSFEKMALELGLSYKGTAAIYYRAIRKIKNKMREMD